MPGRKFFTNDLYRYGFNSQEQSTEIDPNGNSTYATFWQYDARLGRRWNIDPVSKENESPYATLSNNPIFFLDPHGNDPEKPKDKGSMEGQQQITSETTYNRRFNTPKTSFTTWNWHAGGLGTGQFKTGPDGKRTEILTEAGWYTSEGYLNVLSSSNVAKQLASDVGFSWVNPGVGSREGLSKFIGEGLNENASNYLNAAAWKVGNKANFQASGNISFSGFNVQDMLGFGLLMKAGLKMIGSYAVNNISMRLSSSAIMKNTTDDFVALFKPINEFDGTKILYRGTTGSESRNSFIFLTDDATVAASYIKNEGQVMKYELSHSSLYSLRMKGILKTKEDLHKIGGKEIRHYKYEFEGSAVRNALNLIATPNK